MFVLHHDDVGTSRSTDTPVVFRSRNNDRPQACARRVYRLPEQPVKTLAAVPVDILRTKARYGGVDEVPFSADYIAGLANGDPDTEHHFSAYFEDLLRIKLRSRLRDPFRREDVKQETFMRVLRAIREKPDCIERPDRLGAYVNAVCNNVLLEEYRAIGRYHELPANEPEIQSDRESPDQAVVTAERKRHVRTVLDEMTAKDRLVIDQVFFEERDKDDICKEFGVTREYLRVLLHRAKSRFKELFEIKVARKRVASAE